jgi:3'(2'), 5'-bisphosphate nucleotidase
MTDIQPFLDKLLALIREADTAIMSVYDSNTAEVTIKDDNSPLTQADTASHDILTRGLSALFPDIPVLSEEGDELTNQQILAHDRFWLVDPIDGTKNFVNRDGEFTVCVGLIAGGKPVFGIVSIPAQGVIYYGSPSFGSFKVYEGQPPERIHSTAEPRGVVMGSLTHSEQGTNDYIAAHYPNHKVWQRGSMIKFLEIADGNADAYPRFGASMKLWDVAAGHAIVEGAGGKVTRPDGSPLDYHDSSFLIGDFVASA